MEKITDGMREKDGKEMILSFPYISSKVTDKNVGECIPRRMEKNWYTSWLKGNGRKSILENATAKNYDLMSDYSWGAPWDARLWLQWLMIQLKEQTHCTYAAQLGLPMKSELDKTIKALLIEPDETKLNEMYKYAY